MRGNMDNNEPKEGDLKVWWIPQIPGKPFEVPVESVAEAQKLLDVLAKYDIFQYENKVKPDYCNAGGLVVYEMERVDGMDHRGDWVDWTNEEGDSIDDLRRAA